MKRWIRRSAPALSFVLVSSLAPGAPQEVPPRNERDRGDVTLPNGKSQKDAILKADREQNIKDATRLAELSQELKEDLEKADHNVLSVATLKKTDEIEKLARKIRSRIRRD